MTRPDAQIVADALALDASVIATRLEALGLGAAELGTLRTFGAAATAGAARFLDDLYERLRAEPTLAQLLGNDARVASLKRAQAQYLDELFNAPRDWAYVLSRVNIGVAHQRARISPQWFLATYAHMLTAHVPLLFARDPAHGLRNAMLLLKAVFFDATIALDAYGMSELLHQRGGARHAEANDTRDERTHEHRSELASREERTRAVTRVQVTGNAVDQRKRFIGLTDAHAQRIASMHGAWQAALPEVLEKFYAFFSSRPETAALVPAEAVPRLQLQVRSYWEEFSQATFDRAYAASRTRVGIVHERIGLSPQAYLVGLAYQCEGLLAAGTQDRADAAELVDAFVRGVLFDVMHVLDAYMEARADSLLRSEGYASQLIDGLSSGVLIVDGNRRVLSVNRSLVEQLGMDPALLLRVPLANAVPVPELGALLEGLDREPGNRTRRTTVLTMLGRTFRVSALALDPWPEVSGEPIALLFDDVSDLVRLADDSERSDARMAALIHTVDAAMWELDPATWTIELMSASVLTLTGFRDLYFVGRRHAFIERVHAADRDRFIAYCETLPIGARGALEHRMVRADGQQIWVRTALRKVSQDTRDARVFGVTVDTTSERLAEQRRQERDLAEFSNRAKSEFLATMSHDIRTPLNGVIGMLDYLLESRSDHQLGSEATSHIRTAQRSAVELLDLLNDILDISRLEAGRMELHPERFDLVALAEALQDLFSVQATAKGLTLSLELDPAVPSAWIGDAPRIRQVLANLVGNAVKFTTRGSVRLLADGRDGALRLRVIDTGQGIPEDKRGLLFEPFTQAHVSWGGTGLGLSICKRLAELMGGDVTYSAPAEGGSCFEVQLPLHTADPVAWPAGDGRRVVSLLGAAQHQLLHARLAAAGWIVEAEPSGECSAYFIDDASLLTELPHSVPVILCGQPRPGIPAVPRHAPVHALSIAPLNEQRMVELLQALRVPAAHAQRHGGAILVAEDNEVSQRVVRLMLERLGFDVDIVTNGQLAVDAAMQKSYALVLMDMLMPEVDGLEASRRIRTAGPNMRTPIVALTANAYASAQDAALAAGMDAVLTKPLQLQALQHMVARYVPDAGSR